MWRLKSVPIFSKEIALYAPISFSELTIQKSVLDTFFLCGALWLCGALRSDGHWRGYLGLGAIIGSLCLSRENALVFAPILLAWVAWQAVLHTISITY